MEVNTMVYGKGEPALGRLTLKGIEPLLVKVYPEFYEWDSIFNASSPDYVSFLLEKLDAVFFTWKNGDSLAEYYVDLGIPNSESYVKWYNELSETLTNLGLTESSYYGPIINGEAPQHVLFLNEPWDNDFYDELNSTNDYWWFLVCFFSKVGSRTLDGLSSIHISKILLKLEEENIKGYNSSWLIPLDIWIKKFKLIQEYENISFKSISDFNLTSLDFSTINFVDITNIPEYELDNYIGYKGKYYEPFELFKAITASGGLAQSLEKQDLEPKVTNVSSILRKTKKRKR